VGDFIAGCDGGYGISRDAIPEGSVRKDYFRVYPFRLVRYSGQSAAVLGRTNLCSS
jgi:hypothetical protein